VRAGPRFAHSTRAGRLFHLVAQRPPIGTKR